MKSADEWRIELEAPRLNKGIIRRIQDDALEVAARICDERHEQERRRGGALFAAELAASIRALKPKVSQ